MDIRIIFPDGTDYIVLTKKKMYNLNGTIFNLRMTEDELLRFNSAMVDAATLGARLYTTRYVERMLRMQKPNLPMSLQMPKQTRQKLQILQKLPVLIQQSKESNDENRLH